MVPSGKCFCGQPGLYYAGSQHFCGDHKALAVDTARTRQVRTVAGSQRVGRFQFGEEETKEVQAWSLDRIFRRRIDRPTYNI